MGTRDLTRITDSTYAGDLDSGKSISSYVFFLRYVATSWSFKKQSIVAISIREVEYIVKAIYTS